MRAPRQILVICLRRLGDVLLATPLIRSLRRAWPEARIEVLVYAGTAGVLEGNPDIDAVLATPERTGLADTLRLCGRLLRRYDLAVCTLASDRPQFYAWLAAPVRASVVPPAGQGGARWKRWLSHAFTPVDLHHCHAIVQYLRLADALGIARVSEVVPPRAADAAQLDARLGPDWRARRFAVLHPAPMFRYKAWTRDGWVALIGWLAQRGIEVVLSGGPAPEERAAVAAIAQAAGLPAAKLHDLSGQLRLAELSLLLERAQLFVGPDTVVTHLAAACGAPTIALFGPSHPVAWGPWPRDCGEIATSPWVMRAPLQQSGNVWLLQGITPCMPCLAEGCERHVNSRADCLDLLPASRVTGAAAAALKLPA